MRWKTSVPCTLATRPFGATYVAIPLVATVVGLTKRPDQTVVALQIWRPVPRRPEHDPRASNTARQIIRNRRTADENSGEISRGARACVLCPKTDRRDEKMAM